MLISMTPTELPRSSLPLRAPHLRTAYRFNLRGNPAGHRLRRARSVGVCLAQLKPWSALTSYIPALPKHPNPVMQGGVAAAEREDVQEVFENERFYGITWKPPPVLDRAAWTDCTGNAVQLRKPPHEDPGEWELVVTPGTDDDGWQYGTVFHHLEFKRPGGRSSQRFGDMVRRRLWRRRAPSPRPSTQGDEACALAAAAAAAGDSSANRTRSRGLASPGAPGTDASAALAGAAGAELLGVQQGAAGAGAGGGEQSGRSALSAYEAEAKKRAMKAFMSLVLDLLQRRRLWSIIPWDPSALLVLYRKHQQVYTELQAQAYERRLFAADLAAPPSRLRPQQRTMLQDVLAAAMHSRAAYGYPMAAGHVSSVMSYVKLQTVQQLSFDAVGGVSVEANNEAVGALAGIDPADILLSQWRNYTYRPCHYVAIDRANQCVVVAVRGTLQVGDLLSDLSAHPMEVSMAGVAAQGGWVHQGIFTAATYIHCNTQEALREAARRCPGWPVLLTGHSLGGGVAALVAMLMQESGLPEGLGPLHCITIGSAAVMSESLAAACEDYVTTIIVGSDVVPHLSYASVESLLVEASEASPVRQAAESLGKSITQALEGISLPEALKVGGAALEPLSWRPLREATERGAALNGGLGRMLPFLSDDAQSMRAAANAAQAAHQAAHPFDWQQAQQRQQQQQQASPPRMIPLIDLNREASLPAASQPQRVEVAQAQQRLQQQERPAQQLQQQQRQQQATAGGQGTDHGQQSSTNVAAVTLGPAAGLEGMFTPAGEEEQCGCRPGEAQQAQRGAEQEDDSPLLLPFGAGDVPLLGTAMAREEVEHPPGSEEAAGEAAPTAADPELLYPPGRLIWIFPADEDLSSLTGGDAAAVAAGVAAGAAEAAAHSVMSGSSSGGAVPERGDSSRLKSGGMDIEMTEAGASHARAAASRQEHTTPQAQGQGQGQEQGQGVSRAEASSSAPGDGLTDSELEALRQEAEAATASMAAREGEHVRRGQQAPAGGVMPGGELDMEEAIEQVEEGEGRPDSADASGAPARRTPVVVEAERHSFERILLMPDMINDHLPDRYLAAIQQL